jgi:fructokinase
LRDGEFGAPIRQSGALRIGIDFGGTKIEAASVDGGGQVRARLRVPNPGDYDAALLAVRDLIARVQEEAGPAETIGIGSPGSVSPLTGAMRNSNSEYLNGRRFREDLEALLKQPLRIANDANCFALSEAVDGAAAGARVVFGMIIGTGCGGGLVVDQRIVEGASGIAGELGHLPLPWPDADELPAPPCWCGLAGCAELWVSGTGFARAFHAATGRALAAPAIVDAAREGDVDAGAALDRYIDRIGRTIAVIANLVDPDVIVLGGGMSNVAELYPALPDVIRRYSFSDVWNGRVVQARWGDSSGVRGAARLWG